MTALQLHDYQRAAVEFLRGRGRAALFLDMGLGKTAIALSALQPQHLPVLVTAPKRVAENVWAEEAALWRPDLSIAVAKGDPKQRARALDSGADIVVLGRDVLEDATARERIGRWNTFIIDELSGFKSRTSARWRHAKKIILGGTDYVWGLTGTPAPSTLLDLWPQVFLLDGGKRLSPRITDYRSRYFYPGAQLPSGVVIEWNLRPGADKAIHRKLEDLAISMETEGRVTLPEVRFNDVEVPLPATVKRLYRDFKKTLVANLSDIGIPLNTRTAESRAILSNKLQQITAGALYADTDDDDKTIAWLHTEKVKAVREIVDGTGTPVLIAYRYQFEKELLLKEFPNAATADTPDLQRRWNAGELPLLISHPASIGHGLNLQKGPGHTIIWVTPTWNLEEYQQFNKRLARQGSPNTYVMIHRLICPGTVDPLVYASLSGKDDVQQALLDHLRSPL